MDRFRSLTCYCKVVELSGITEAGKALRISKAAVSKAIASLEEELGVRLLHRTTRAVRPTATGRVVYARARAVLAELEELEAAARADKAEPVGTLRISAPVAFGLLHLRDHIAAFAKAHPAVRIELALTDRYVRIVEEGFDLAIRIATEPDDGDVVAVSLARTAIRICASPGYLRRAGRPRRPRDLLRHTCISYDAPGGTGRVPWYFEGETLLIDPAIRVDNSVLLRDLARAGVGIASLMSFVCAGDLATGALISLFQGAPDATRTIYAMYPSPRHATAKVRAFVRFLQAAYRESPDWT